MQYHTCFNALFDTFTVREAVEVELGSRKLPARCTDHCSLLNVGDLVFGYLTTANSSEIHLKEIFAVRVYIVMSHNLFNIRGHSKLRAGKSTPQARVIQIHDLSGCALSKGEVYLEGVN